MIEYINKEEKKLHIRLDEIVDKKVVSKRWVWLKPGEKILMDNEGYAERLGLFPVKQVAESKTKKGVVKEEDSEAIAGTDSSETGSEKDIDFKKELLAIKGIGKKTVKDILQTYPEKALLLEAIKSEEALPFRDDISKILIESFK